MRCFQELRVYLNNTYLQKMDGWMDDTDIIINSVIVRRNGWFEAAACGSVDLI